MKNIYKLLTLTALIAMLISCRKTEELNVDYSAFNADNPTTNTPLDQWLKSSFLDPYNIEVVYRYNRYYHGNSANVTPTKLENIQPTMQIVLDGFINPYLKVAGPTFTKKYMPKEWVLFGSYSYDDANADGVAGTAAAGRRITLYGVNDYQPLPSGQFYAWDRHRIMHHEFGHILNQIIPIPTDFEAISKGFYKQPYRETSTETAHANGFVTAYASGVSTEDYAETISWSLINGQAWYDYWAATASDEGKVRLNLKQQNIINYYKNLGIDFKALQKEVQLYMRNTLDLRESKFPYWLSQKMTMTIDNSSLVSVNYGVSSAFSSVYNTIRTNVNAIPGYGFTFNNIRINFTTPTTANLEISFNQGSGSYLANFGLTMTLNQTTGEVKFGNGVAGGTTAPWVGNANIVKSAIQPMLDYLTASTTIFIADWMPTGITADNFMKYGGLYVKGAPTNYFYGSLVFNR